LEKNCIRQKQFASNPESQLFPLMASNAKTFDGEQKSPVQTLISHNLAQFCTICTIIAQFLHNRQRAALIESNLGQAQKDGYPHFVHK
jgi:hypothetical protein